MNCSVYISDEGMGPIVRQQAVTEEISKLIPNCSFDIKTSDHIEAAKRIIPYAHHFNVHNNINWSKNDDGSPDILNIKQRFEDYIERSDDFINKELISFNGDFVISDFVVEAFEISSRKNIPSFGIAHFTWEWFFNMLDPKPLNRKTTRRFKDYTQKADVLFFPPFTPKEIINEYKEKVIEVPLIVRKHHSKGKKLNTDKFKVLLIDSGAGVLFNSIQGMIKSLSNLPEIDFYASSTFATHSENLHLINKDELFVDYINEVDLVIGRAGFNTISECIACRTPMLLIGEASNPEMKENIDNIRQLKLGSFMILKDFTNNFESTFKGFIDSEYNTILTAMKMHNYPTNGAEEIAKQIANRI